MTAYDSGPAASPYQPPPKKSGRTVAWGIGRAIVWFVYAFALVAIVIASLAFVLQLFGADPSSGFAQWVYRSASRVTAPFRGIFPSHVNGNSVHALVEHQLERLDEVVASLRREPLGQPEIEQVPELDRFRGALVGHRLLPAPKRAAWPVELTASQTLAAPRNDLG